MRARISTKAAQFTESVIREMTRLLLLYHGSGGINLAQGFPDFPCPDDLKQAVCDAIFADLNQYAITWGAKPLRDAIAWKQEHFYGTPVDPETEVTVTCGATEAMIATMLALVNEGDEVIIFRPFYENYGPDCILSGATPRYVTLHEPDWAIDEAELRAAFSARTRAIVVNTPHNPTGKVFSRAELELIAELCQEHDAYAFTDEIYEHMVYEGEHISLAALPGMWDRVVTISGISKTYSVTGWRVGYTIACGELTGAIRKVHDFLTVGAAAPIQAGAAMALRLPSSYYAGLLAGYRERRDIILGILGQTGFRVYPPAGAYYVMTDIAGFGFESDVAFAQYLCQDVGVATVPGSSFYDDPELGRTKIRFAFPKRTETLHRAGELLRKLDLASAHRS